MTAVSRRQQTDVCYDVYDGSRSCSLLMYKVIIRLICSASRRLRTLLEEIARGGENRAVN